MVSTSVIVTFLRAECKGVGLARLRFAPEDVEGNSLRSGGATAMHIANIPDQTLMAIGRWSSLGFLVYI